MRTSTRMIAGAATLAFALGGTAYIATGAEGPGAGPGPQDRVVTASATTSIDDDAAREVAFMREEERMARDLYTALDAHYEGLAPFSNIKVSEQRHHDAVGRLIDAYGLEDPSAGLEPGEYEYAELQDLYDGWLERGLTSQDEAFMVGVELETADIADLQAAIDQIDDARIDRVLGNLLNGSEHHLAAFEAAAAGELPECDGPCDGTGMQQRQGQKKGPGKGQQGQRQGMGQHDGTGDCPFATGQDG